MNHGRRAFLANVGRGAAAAALGFGVAGDLGLSPAWADDGADLDFGPLEPLVRLLQDTPAPKLMPVLVEKLRTGTELRTLAAAGALANARSFAGEHYIGYHSLMALGASVSMAAELPAEQRALPVLKVLYRSTEQIQAAGGRAGQKLRPVAAGELPAGAADGPALRERVRKNDADGAERCLAALAKASPERAFNALLHEVQDNTEIHRVALAWRAWDLRELVGLQHAHTLLRQSLRYCLQTERGNRSESWDRPRTLLPRLFDEHKLDGRTPGRREADDAWIAALSTTIFEGAADQAAGAAAAALAEGFAPEAVGEAIALAANQLILRDPGRPAAAEAPGKPMGTVHGDSIGVHACDSAHAWRRLALAADARNTFACLILGAYQACYDRHARGADFVRRPALPLPFHLERAQGSDPAALLRDLDDAVRNNLQARACAVVERLGLLGHPARPVFDVLLKYAVSEDGALHAEKYYRTALEEHEATRPAFRRRHLVALARVTASEYGRPAAGVEEARRLLAT